jgi:YHS domain-containing protein
MNVKSIKFWIVTVLAGALPCGCSGPSPAASSSQSPAAQVSPAGGGASTAAASPAYAYSAGSLKKGDMAICVVCAVNEGSKEKEAAKETIDYEGKAYAFCNEDEKAQFISSPAKFAAK